jgi:hypothetical protein
MYHLIMQLIPIDPRLSHQHIHTVAHVRTATDLNMTRIFFGANHSLVSPHNRFQLAIYNILVR